MVNSTPEAVLACSRARCGGQARGASEVEHFKLGETGVKYLVCDLFSNSHKGTELDPSKLHDNTFTTFDNFKDALPL